MRILSLPLASLLMIGCMTEPQPVTITFCPDQVPEDRIFIRNDGAALGLPGQWSTVASSGGKAFSFTPASRMTIAFSEQETSNTSRLRMFQLTADELPKLNCLPSTIGGARNYTVTIAGVGAGKSAQVWLGTGLLSRGNGSFTLQNFVAGGSDLVSFVRAGTPFSVEKFIVRRGIDLQSGAVLSPLDFASAEAVLPRLNTATINGAGSTAAPGTASAFYRLVTNGTNVLLPTTLTNGTVTMTSLPAAAQTPTDFYVLGAAAYTVTAFTEGRSVSARFATPTDRSLVLGPALTLPVTAYRASAGPTPIGVTLPVQSEYAERADVGLRHETNGNTFFVTMTMTRAYRGARSAWNFETPDPSSLPQRSIQFDPAGFTDWRAYAASGDNSSLFLGGTTSELTIREAFVDGAIGGGAMYHSFTNTSSSERSCRLCLRKLLF